MDGPGGGKFANEHLLSAHVKECWDRKAGRTRGSSRPLVICTGGEPLLQVDEPLISALHDAGIEVGVETNGTVDPPQGLDWICVSPKSTAPLKITAGDELKLVFRQEDAPPEKFADLDFEHFFLQPMDGPDVIRHTAAAVEYCMANPQWRLSLQTHKMLGID